jgi:glycosyltransferase involved in cell wall biosynthesis
VPPLVANHSGLAEVALGIAAEYPPTHAGLTSFPNGDAAALHDRVLDLLSLAPEERRELGLAARRAVESRWSWERVSEQLLEPLAFS